MPPSAESVAMADAKTQPTLEKNVDAAKSPLPAVASKEKSSVTVEVVERSPSPQPQRKPTYRPFAHRPIPLLVLVLIVLGLIGALEGALRVLPSARLNDKLGGNATATTTSASATASGTIIPTAGSSNVAVRRRQDQSLSTTTSESGTPTASESGTMTAMVTSLTTSSADPSSPTGDSESSNEPQASPASTEFADSRATTVDVSGGAGAPGPSQYQSAQATSIALTAGGSVGITGTNGTDGNGKGKSAGPPLVSNVPLALAEKSFNFFLGAYGPVLFAVLLRLLVTPLYRCTKLVDPFDQLAGADGAPFRDFFLAHHLGTETLSAPYQAYRRKRWNLFWAASLYATVQILTPLASELTKIRYSSYTENGKMVLGQSVWIDSIVVRVVQGLLALISVQTTAVWYIIWKSEPSLPANPASIATIASLTGHPQTARDFSRIDQTADLRVTMGRFRDRRYRLESYTARDGTQCYGLVPKGGRIRAPPPPNQNTVAVKTTAWSRAMAWLKTGATNAKKDDRPNPIAWQDVRSLIFVTAAAGTLFGLVLAYYLTSTDTSFERFMDSEQFGPRFLLSVLAMILKTPLRSLWLSVIAAVPWSRLAAARSRGAGSSVHDVLEAVPVALTPLGGIVYALRRNEWFAAGLSVAAGLVIEALIVLLPGVPFDRRQIYKAALVSWIGCLTCLSFILLVVLIGWLRMAFPQGRPAWPRPPVTVGAVAMYVGGSAMAKDFAADPATVPPPATRYRFGKSEGQWRLDYATDTVGEESG